MKSAISEENSIKYKSLGELREAEIVVYLDAAFNKFERSHSSLGMLLFLAGKENANLLDWFCKKTAIPVTSPLASEAEASKEAFSRATFIQAMIKEVTGSELPIKLVTDSKSLKDHVMTDNATKDRRIALAVGILREALDKEIISVKWINSEENLADVLTKDSVNPYRLRASLSQARLPSSFSNL